MENKIITKLPTKEGIGKYKFKKTIDWNEMVGKTIEVLYNNKKRDIYIKEYDSKSRYLIIQDVKNKNYLRIFCGSFKKCKIGKLYKDKFIDWISKNNENISIDFTRCEKELSLSKDSIENLSKCSGEKLFFKCNKCGHEITSKISAFSMVNYGKECEYCSDKISYPEKFIINLLEQLKVDFETQYSPKWINNKRYDFYMPNSECIIETHGKQHYSNKTNFKSLGGRTLEEEQANDKLKKEIALQNGINNYIELDCRESNLEWIKNSILNSKLNELFDLSNIDWLKCDINSQKSYKIQTWKLINQGKDVKYIASKFNINENTVYSYLKDGIKYKMCNYMYKEIINKTNKNKAIQLWNKKNFSVKEIADQLGIYKETVVRYLNEGYRNGICSYNSELEKKRSICKSLAICREKNSKRVICLNDKKIYQGVAECAKINNLNFRNISLNCRGNRASCGKDKNGNPLRWMFVEDYNIIKNKLQEYKDIRSFLKNKYNN